ncbi:MAG TPA: FKBP-type peptidyl-prolyl cis-trans isomerase [Methanoregulaceae archaeon]|nr:FKBP-type peptidyl-prolyl cis-trans isomerase [Methanoregulaceae archaeon]
MTRPQKCPKRTLQSGILAGATIALVVLSLVLAGCTSQPQVVKVNDTVRVHYTASLAKTGETFESSLNSTPIEFVVGTGQVIKGFDNAVIGMTPGQTKNNVFIPVDQAYGPHRDDLVYIAQKTGALANYTQVPGQLTYVTMRLPSGQIVRYPIIASNATTVTIDANNPLAGQDLLFNITLVEIVKK